MGMPSISEAWRSTRSPRLTLVSHESPVGDPINANAGVSIRGDPRDGNFAPDVVATPSSTQKSPDSCDDRACKEHDNRGNQIRGHTGVQGTGCGHESNVSEASHCDANAEHGADGGDPSSPHPSRPTQTISLVEPSLKALRMHREGAKLSPLHDAREYSACRLASPAGLLRLACDEQAVLLCRVRDLHLDAFRDELFGMVDARHALIEILERLERTLLTLLEDRPHCLLAQARQEFKHVEPRRDRLRAVEEVDKLCLLLLHRLLDDERQFLLRGGRQLLETNAALHVEHLLAHVDVLADVHPLPHGQRHALFRHELEQFEFINPEGVRERLPMELRLIGVTLR